MFSEPMRFECPFGEEDDCPEEITVEVAGDRIEDAYGCHHVEPLSAERAERLWDLIEDRYIARYDEAMESRVDNWRDRDLS